MISVQMLKNTALLVPTPLCFFILKTHKFALFIFHDSFVQDSKNSILWHLRTFGSAPTSLAHVPRLGDIRFESQPGTERCN
jgi:hypothetical protein